MYTYIYIYIYIYIDAYMCPFSQFAVVSPEGTESVEEQERMIENSKDFYKSLGIPFHVVNIVSGELNDAAAKKCALILV